MAVLTFCLSAKIRGVLFKVTLVACSLGIFVSVLYVAGAIFCHVNRSSLLRDLIPGMFAMYLSLIPLGVFHILLAAVGLKLTLNSKRQPLSLSLPRIHMVIWSIFLLFSCAVTALSIPEMFRVQRTLQNEFMKRLKYGFSRYSSSAEWQAIVDRVQVDLGCCGAAGYGDWYSTAWLPVSAVPSKVSPSVYTKLVQPNGKVKAPLVPTSCCRDPADSLCGHLAWLKDPKAVPTQADPSKLHETGCAVALQNVVSQDMLYFKAMLILNVLLQVAMLVCLRYFSSSTFSSLVMGQPLEVGPGWLFGSIRMPLEHVCNPELRKEEEEIEKPKWNKKMLKCCKKKQKDTEQDSDSNSTTKPKGKSLKPPCLDKLKRRCKKKKKTEEKDLEIKYGTQWLEVNYPEEVEEMKVPVRAKAKTTEEKDLEIKHGTQWLEVNYPEEVEEMKFPVRAKAKITEERNNFSTSNGSLKKKRTLSKNLVDLEDDQTLEKNPYSKNRTEGVYQAEIPSTSIFTRYATDTNNPKTQVDFSVMPTRGSTTRTGPRKQSYDMDVDRDFQKTRSLFEDNAKGVYRVEIEPPENIIEEQVPNQVKSEDVIEKSPAPPLFLKNYGVQL